MNFPGRGPAEPVVSRMRIIDRSLFVGLTYVVRVSRHKQQDMLVTSMVERLWLRDKSFLCCRNLRKGPKLTCKRSRINI